MGRSRQDRGARRTERNENPTEETAPAEEQLPAPGTTGRYLVLLREDSMQEGVQALNNVAGLKNVISTADFESGVLEAAQAESSDVILFHQLGVAVVKAP